MENKFGSVRNRLAAYQHEAEQWKADHDLAMKCLDFELLLQTGVSIYEALNFIDERWRHQVAAGQQPYSAEMDDAVRALYQWWLSPCDRILAELREFEKNGFVLEHAKRFTSACVEVRGLLTDDSEFFDAPDIDRMSRQAIEEYSRSTDR